MIAHVLTFLYYGQSFGKAAVNARLTRCQQDLGFGLQARSCSRQAWT